MNDSNAIISSLNLYEFSQVNNNEMGVLLTRTSDTDAFMGIYDEVVRLLKISQQVGGAVKDVLDEAEDGEGSEEGLKLTTSKLGRKYNLKAQDTLQQLCSLGYLEARDDRHYLTEKGKGAGGEFRMGRHGIYFLWPGDLNFSA